MPVLTAGGRREAEIATPTRLDVLSPRMESATPMPEGIAIRAPADKHGRTILSREAACTGARSVGVSELWVRLYLLRAVRIKSECIF